MGENLKVFGKKQEKKPGKERWNGAEQNKSYVQVQFEHLN